jgi:aflatoxin B1 aldehyde reductase
VNHSELNGDCGDQIILGASKLGHLIDNIQFCNEGGRLPDTVVKAFDEAWKHVLSHGVCPKYFRP